MTCLEHVYEYITIKIDWVNYNPKLIMFGRDYH